MDKNIAIVELYAVKLTDSAQRGQYMVYEKHPIPGGKDMPVLVRPGKKNALKEAKAYLAEYRDGSCFKAERSVVKD